MFLALQLFFVVLVRGKESIYMVYEIQLKQRRPGDLPLGYNVKDYFLSVI